MNEIKYFEKGSNGLELKIQHVSEIIAKEHDINEDNIFAKSMLADQLQLLDKFDNVSQKIDLLMKSRKNEIKNKNKLH